MDYLEYNGKRIEYKMEQSNRKTVSIRVTREGVVVRAPRGLSKSKIANLVETKTKWIFKKYEEITDVVLPEHEYCNGSPFLYRGKQYSLSLREASAVGLKMREAKVWIMDHELNVAIHDSTAQSIRSVLEQWYRLEARKRITQRVSYFASNYQFAKQYNRIFIKDQKSRWGSCSTKGNLNFNYRLIMAPDEVLDYVVVHELCHLTHMNHSKEFWSLVQSILPDCTVWKEWLRRNGAKLSR